MRRFSFLIILLALACVSYFIEFTKETNWEYVQRISYKDVLIIGDSISIGYTPYVKAKLKNKADINRPIESEFSYFPIRHGVPLNCCGTSLSLENIDQWLMDKKWDVIFFNWGLWDTVQIDVEVYNNNLEILIEKMKRHGKTLIMATTTPIIIKTDGGKGMLERATKVRDFNHVATQLANSNGIALIDLHMTMVGKKKYYKADGIHLNQDGYRFLAEEVIRAIENVL